MKGRVSRSEIDVENEGARETERERKREEREAGRVQRADSG